jgi:hypothetical protein
MPRPRPLFLPAGGPPMSTMRGDVTAEGPWRQRVEIGGSWIARALAVKRGRRGGQVPQLRLGAMEEGALEEWPG